MKVYLLKKNHWLLPEAIKRRPLFQFIYEISQNENMTYLKMYRIYITNTKYESLF